MRAMFELEVPGDGRNSLIMEKAGKGECAKTGSWCIGRKGENCASMTLIPNAGWK